MYKRQQFTPPHDKGVTAEVLAITDLSTVKTMSREAAIAAGKYEIIGQAIDDKFIAHVKAQVVNQDAIDKMQKDIRIVYTPLHGTGNIPARRALKELGFENVYLSLIHIVAAGDPQRIFQAEDGRISQEHSQRKCLPGRNAGNHIHGAGMYWHISDVRACTSV